MHFGISGKTALTYTHRSAQTRKRSRSRNRNMCMESERCFDGAESLLFMFTTPKRVARQTFPSASHETLERQTQRRRTKPKIHCTANASARVVQISLSSSSHHHFPSFTLGESIASAEEDNFIRRYHRITARECSMQIHRLSVAVAPPARRAVTHPRLENVSCEGGQQVPFARLDTACMLGAVPIIGSKAEGDAGCNKCLETEAVGRLHVLRS